MSNQPLTVEQLLILLRLRPLDQAVRFDFCGLVPRYLDSYRGYYDHLAFAWEEPTHLAPAPTVQQVVDMLENAVGKIFTGYKGGEFTMGYQTPVWVANYGRSHGTAIVGIDYRTDWCTIIQTAHCDDWAGGFERAMRTFGPVLFGIDVGRAGSDASREAPRPVGILADDEG